MPLTESRIILAQRALSRKPAAPTPRLGQIRQRPRCSGGLRRSDGILPERSGERPQHLRGKRDKLGPLRHGRGQCHGDHEAKNGRTADLFQELQLFPASGLISGSGPSLKERASGNFGNKWQCSGIMLRSGGHRTCAKTAPANLPRGAGAVFVCPLLSAAPQMKRGRQPRRPHLIFLAARPVRVDCGL